MSLKTGHKLHGYHWVKLPISDKVIKRVEQLAEEQGQPLMENGPIFEWSPGELIVEVDVDDNVKAMHKEMDNVEYPGDDDNNYHDPDEGGIPIARRPTLVTDKEELEDLDEDRSNDDKEYDGEWTNKLRRDDSTNEDYESRSNL